MSYNTIVKKNYGTTMKKNIYGKVGKRIQTTLNLPLFFHALLK